MRRKAKISDIAQKGGVSLSTVSLVLNNKPGVSAETRTKILEIAKEVEYPVKFDQPSNKETSLKTVGMVIKTDPDIIPQANPFYSKVIIGIEDVCRRKGINLLFSTLPVDDNNHPIETPHLLSNPIIDGLLMVGTFIDETILSISSRSGPAIVLVDGYSDWDRFDTVISDNFGAAYHAVEYLLSKGHRHIGLVGSEADSYPSLKDRRNGYIRALKDHNINESYIADLNINKTKGYQETIKLLQTHPSITALFCINDDIAITAIRAAKYLGRQVPEDLSVIGYDDTYIALNTHPPLSTMHVDTLAMGRAAVHLLSLRRENPELSRMTLTIHPTLVERDSVSNL
jgi:LacI family transcriptional regulator